MCISLIQSAVGVSWKIVTEELKVKSKLCLHDLPTRTTNMQFCFIKETMEWVNVQKVREESDFFKKERM